MSIPAEAIITPHRATQVEYDPPRWEQLRQAWFHRQTGAQIKKDGLPAPYLQNLDVTQLGGEIWTLSPFKGDPANALKDEFLNGWVGEDDVNLAPSMVFYHSYTKPTDTLNAGIDATVAAATVPAFEKAYAPGADLSLHRLTADEAAFPKPETGGYAPLDRVLVSKKTYAANAGFILQSTRPPLGDDNKSAVLTFYFGGRCDVRPLGKRGGEYAAVLTGEGAIRLYEFNGTTWDKRFTTEGLNKEIAPNLLTLAVVPFGRDGLYVTVGGLDFAALGMFAGVFPLNLSSKLLRASIHEDRQVAHHRHLKTLTGAGQIRVDQSRIMRQSLSIKELRYPLTGRVVARPLVIPWPMVDDGEKIRCKPVWDGPPGTNATVQVYSSATHMPLTQDADGNWLTVLGQRSYYVVATLTTTDPEITPAYDGYKLDYPGVSQLRAPETTVTTWLERVSISGPDLTPDLETAHYSARDVNSEHPALGERGTVPIRITTTCDEEGTLSVLFQGDTVDHDVLLRGPTAGPKDDWPADDWKAYNPTAVGEWGRIAEQRSLATRDFSVDDGASPDPHTSVRPPWKITGIVYWVLSSVCGYPDEMLDIPDYPIRLYPTDQASKNDLLLMPAVDLTVFLNRLIREYLGAVLFFDANAGSYGMWRIIPYKKNPGSDGYPNLAKFVLRADADDTIPHAPESYPDEDGIPVTFILRGSYRPKRKRPEGNFVQALGITGPGASPLRISRPLVNPKSFSFPGFPPATDTSHPDYLGRFAPIYVKRPECQTSEAVNFICRRVMQMAGHGQDWVAFVAPLLLITDPNDTKQTTPRPLRIFDPVMVDTPGGIRQALVRSCSPDYEHDWQQWARYWVQFEPEDPDAQP